MKKNILFSIVSGLAFIASAYFIFPENPYQDFRPIVQSFRDYSKDELFAMQNSLKDMLDIQNQLARLNSNVVMEVLKNEDEFYDSNHYPKGEVYDPLTECQYYYHAHRAGEHGHFHTFHICDPNPEHYRFAHLISISMDNFGNPIKLFAVTQWHEGEVLLNFEEAKWRIQHFQITHNYPSEIVNRWLNNAYKAFEPQMVELMQRHIAKLEKLDLKKKHKEIITSTSISLEKQEVLLKANLSPQESLERAF
jgi:hypothetical protein